MISTISILLNQLPAQIRPFPLPRILKQIKRMFVMVTITLLFDFTWMTENSFGSICEVSEELDSLLSQRIDKLNRQPLKIKSFSQLGPAPQVQSNKVEQSIRSSINKSQSSTPEKSMTSSKKSRHSSKLKHSIHRRNSPMQQPRDPLQKSKLFEIVEGGRGRHSALRQVRELGVRQFCGRGLLVLPNGKKIEGQWVQGNLIGDVKITYSNNDTYFGSLYNFQLHGKGIMQFATGQKYDGEFSGGDFHGEGVLYDREGKVIYDGEWRRGKMKDENPPKP